MSQRFLRFVAVGAIGFVMDAGLTYLLTRYGVSPVLARAPAIAVAILTTWLLNRMLTFRIEEPGTIEELARYFAVAVLSGVLNFAVYSVLVLVGTSPVLAVAIATLLLMFFSFFGYKVFAFKLQH